MLSWSLLQEVVSLEHLLTGEVLAYYIGSIPNKFRRKVLAHQKNKNSRLGLTDSVHVQ